ncbi:hypothetical protein DES52_11333 [Deinococcus yavapaiensis KR-236]|uniref:Uncharacterized protein n=1 Tax=Deinococcus yavapaiensis KR-236 TaxID=694435 RepID=A0A318S2C3_9DEIO|nr:hypothetical protein DES52_11333 [Deinococcus yavapaiensis KR-236]
MSVPSGICPTVALDDSSVPRNRTRVVMRSQVC